MHCQKSRKTESDKKTAGAVYPGDSVMIISREGVGGSGTQEKEREQVGTTLREVANGAQGSCSKQGSVKHRVRTMRQHNKKN